MKVFLDCMYISLCRLTLIAHDVFYCYVYVQIVFSEALHEVYFITRDRMAVNSFLAK